jgi:hypothetical protein
MLEIVVSQRLPIPKVGLTPHVQMAIVLLTLSLHIVSITAVAIVCLQLLLPVIAALCKQSVGLLRCCL